MLLLKAAAMIFVAYADLTDAIQSNTAQISLKWDFFIPIKGIELKMDIFTINLNTLHFATEVL